MKQRILIIADDLTGTCDTGIKFLRRNARVSTIVKADDFEQECLNVDDVVAVNTESRDLPPLEAYRSVYAVTHKVAGTNTTLFKKIDSVMRGNIAQEINAVMDAANLQLAVVAAAYPDNGRRSMNGMLSVREEGGWAQTDMSWLKKLGEGQRKAALVDIAEVRKGVDAICAAIMEQYVAGNGIVTVDAERNEDLQNIAVAICRMGRNLRLLPVGCAGLADYLGGELMRSNSNGYIFVVVGTHHPITRKQIDHIAHRSDLMFYTLDGEQMLNGDCYREMQRVAGQVRRDIEDHRIKTGIVLTVNASPSMRMDNEEAMSQMIVRTLSQTAKAVFDWNAFHFDKFLISGGDTANCVLDAFGIRCIHMLDEPLSGIAYGWADLQTAIPRKVWIATKSGGFGEMASLDDLINYMSRTDQK